MDSIETKQLVNDLGFQWIVGEESCSTQVNIYGINRAGLELSGFRFNAPTDSTFYRRIIMFSNKENVYVRELSDAKVKERYLNIMETRAPLIILTDRFQDERLIKIAREFKFPVVRAHGVGTAELMARVLRYTAAVIRQETEVHGSLVNVYGKGVLMIGPSGIGKSEISLELIKRNHLFIGDDRIIAYNMENKIFGRAHPILFHLIEFRGLGVIDLAKIYGAQNMSHESSIDLVIELQIQKDVVGDLERLNTKYQEYKLLGVVIPRLVLPVSAGRDMADLIETAVAKFKSETEEGESGADLLDRRLATFWQK